MRRRVRLSAKTARKRSKMVQGSRARGRPGLEIGLCGEHGRDPGAVEFCHQLKLDYVSCSPQRMPVARAALLPGR